MADKQAIINAVRNLSSFLKIPELRGAYLRLTKSGMPFLYSGGFNMVFQIIHNDKRWALRVWHVDMDIDQERYQLIADMLTMSKLPHFAQFKYASQALIVNGKAEDIVLMEWLDGLLLKEYVKIHLHESEKIIDLANQFRKACDDLRENQIAHGDLQEGNILVDSTGQLRFIDYDSVIIPALVGESDLVTGLKGYQHPSRFKESKASLKADYFSELIIYLSLLALAYNPSLWLKYQVESTQYLLFTENDFINIDQSDIYRDLSLLPIEIKRLLEILKIYLATGSYKDLIHMGSYLEPPQILTFDVDNRITSIGNKVILTWKTHNATKVVVEPWLGIINNNGNRIETIERETTYKLIATNNSGEIEKIITVQVVPPPQINFSLDRGKILFGEQTRLRWSMKNVSSAVLITGKRSEIIPFEGELIVTPENSTVYEIDAIGLDGFSKTEITKELTVYKRVEISYLRSSTSVILEGLPVTIDWKVLNATQIIIISSSQPDLDVTGKSTITLFPRRTTSYTFRVSNDLSSLESDAIQITVQPLPALPNLNTLSIMPGDLIPKFTLDLSSRADQLLNSSEESFLQAVLPKKKISLISSLTAILSKK